MYGQDKPRRFSRRQLSRSLGVETIAAARGQSRLSRFSVILVEEARFVFLFHYIVNYPKNTRCVHFYYPYKIAQTISRRDMHLYVYRSTLCNIYNYFLYHVSYIFINIIIFSRDISEEHIMILKMKNI